eukprot:1145456-Pelagomonas_calceolata.AAC.3
MGYLWPQEQTRNTITSFTWLVGNVLAFTSSRGRIQINQDTDIKGLGQKREFKEWMGAAAVKALSLKQAPGSACHAHKCVRRVWAQQAVRLCACAWLQAVYKPDVEDHLTCIVTKGRGFVAGGHKGLLYFYDPPEPSAKRWGGLQYVVAEALIASPSWLCGGGAINVRLMLCFLGFTKPPANHQGGLHTISRGCSAESSNFWCHTPKTLVLHQANHLMSFVFDSYATLRVSIYCVSMTRQSQQQAGGGLHMMSGGCSDKQKKWEAQDDPHELLIVVPCCLHCNAVFPRRSAKGLCTCKQTALQHMHCTPAECRAGNTDLFVLVHVISCNLPGRAIASLAMSGSEDYACVLCGSGALSSGSAEIQCVAAHLGTLIENLLHSSKLTTHIVKGSF